MKKVLLFFLIVSLVLLSGCESKEKKFSYEELYDLLFEDYQNEVEKRVAAETKYQQLLKDINTVYDEFLFVHQYLLGSDDISEGRAKEASIFVHDTLEMIRWDR